MAGCHFLSVENREDQAKQMVPEGTHPKNLPAHCGGVFQTHRNLTEREIRSSAGPARPIQLEQLGQGGVFHPPRASHSSFGEEDSLSL